MTQTKLVDLMQNGGYGTAGRGNPYTRGQTSRTRGSPPRQGRGTPPRANVTNRNQETNVTLTNLSISCRGPSKLHGREY
jgi:hypothetical protein